MYNGYNYYPNTSSATSPVYLMPFPYQYDPFFMAPNTEVPLSSEKANLEDPRDDSVESVESNEKSENEGVNANSSTAEEENVSNLLFLYLTLMVLQDKQISILQANMISSQYFLRIKSVKK